jgi:hypothetical protein
MSGRLVEPPALRRNPEQMGGRIPSKGEITRRPGADHDGDYGGNLEEEMPETEIQILKETELEQIELWRTEELERAGYGQRAAVRIATRHDIDLHFAIQLVERGCPPDLALKILL